VTAGRAAAAASAGEPDGCAASVRRLQLQTHL
jgi:hypothetical protein